jgi:hypothetical protein
MNSSALYGCLGSVQPRLAGPECQAAPDCAAAQAERRSTQAELAFDDELLDLVLPYSVGLRWRSPGGRNLAAAYLLPRAEAALRQELQRLADAAKRAREGEIRAARARSDGP